MTLRRLARTSVAYSVTNWVLVLTGLAAAQGMVALALILVARRVSPEEFGQYLSSYWLASLLVVLPGFGLDGWLLSRGTNSPEDLAPLWTQAWKTRVRLLMLWVLGMLVLSQILPSDTYPPAVLIASTVGLIGDSLTTLSYMALRNIRLHWWVSLCQSTGALALLVITLFLPLDHGQIHLFAVARAAMSLLVAVAAVNLVFRQIRQKSFAEPARTSFREIGPFLLSDAATLLYMRADLTIVSLFEGARGSGVYGPALGVVNVCFLVPSALYQFVVPALARMYRESRITFVRRSVLQVLLQTATGAMMAGGLAMLAPLAIVTLFGPAYASTIGVLRLLSPVLLFKGISFGLGATLTASGHQSWRTRVQISVAIFNVLANLIVIGPLGLEGVALVYVASEVLLCSGYCLMTYRGWRAQGTVRCGQVLGREQA